MDRLLSEVGLALLQAMHDFARVDARMPGAGFTWQTVRWRWLIRTGHQNGIESLGHALPELRMREDEQVVVADAVDHPFAGLERIHRRTETGTGLAIGQRR